VLADNLVIDPSAMMSWPVTKPHLPSVRLNLQRRGVPLAEAYRQALQFTGRVVALVGITLAAGMVTWAASPIKFQADLGVLLAFMFVWNMTTRMPGGR
jgi:uncharacterized protein